MILLKWSSSLLKLAALPGLLLLLLGHALTAHAYGQTQCAASRFGSNLGCTANDVSITSIVPVSGSYLPYCVGGGFITLSLDVTVQFQNPSRYDIGVFLSNDGKTPQLLASSGGASSCSVAILPTSSPFKELDGDLCGDGNNSLSGTFTMPGVTVPCTTDGSGNTTLYIPYVVSWDQSSGNYCGNNTYPVPGTTSKCNTGQVDFTGVSIVVMPSLTITDGKTSMLSTDNTTYTIVVTNDTGSTISGAVFKDAQPGNFSYSSASCTAGGGATCPAVDTTNIQTGVTLPAMPNGSSLTFTVKGSLDGNLCGTLTNTASVSFSGQTNSASDSNTVICPPLVSKSFDPSSIAVGGKSRLTITLTNPNATTAITAIAFEDTYPSTNLKNASPTNLSNTCGGTASAAVGGSSLTLSGGGIPANSSCTVAVDVTSAVTGTYINNTGDVETGNAGENETGATATLYVGSVAPASFNAFETGTAAGATAGVIQTKVAGSAFSLDVVAITGGAQASGFSNTIKVELLGNTATGVPLDANNCPTSYTLLQTVSPNPSISGGRSTVSFAAVSDAWKDVRVRISYPTSSPTVTSCSSDNFAIRPNALGAYASHADWETVGTSFTLNNSGTSGSPIHKAGRSFTLVATGYNAASIVTGNYDGSPTAVSAAAVAPATITGNFSVGTFSAGAGTVRSDTATYDEVGAVSLILQDQNFASVDAGDTAGDCSATGRYVCSTTLNIGRFVPDHFALDTVTTPPALTQRSDIGAGAGCIPASAFTYMGEPFKLAYGLRAENAGNVLTQNYTGAFAKLDGATVSKWTQYGTNDSLGLWAIATNLTISGDPTCKAVFSASGPNYLTSYPCTTATPASLAAPAARVSVAASPVPTGSWLNGQGSFTAHAQLNRANTPDGPFDTLSIGIAPKDADGVAILSSALNLDADDSGSNERVTLATGNVRYGRLRLNNAHGSELLDLPIPLEAQYWNGTLFATNTLDNCTTISPSNIALSNFQRNLAACETAVSISGSLVAGKANLKMLKPGAGNSGSVDLTLNLDSAALGSTCLVTGGGTSADIPANMPHLLGRWTGATYNESPKGRATFGTFRNANEFIYLREIY